MNGGYTGKILNVDLTSRKTSIIETAKYEEWGGGHGIGSAVFWDLCKDKTVSGFDPGNVVTIMTSPLSGTNAPAVAGRTEVQGIGVQGYPIEWFTRSNFGGRFSGMLKFAGWDGIAIQGKADKPVWIDMRNDDVQIRDAGDLWGLDTLETQEEIWRRVTGDLNDWWSTGRGRDNGRTTQRPAVLTIGPAGERMTRVASLLHDAGNGAGQGGFGGVFGSKNLKAISVIGTGGVKVAHPNALMAAREWSNKYAIAGNWDNYQPAPFGMGFHSAPGSSASAYAPTPPIPIGPMGCMACQHNCRVRFGGGQTNGSSCLDFLFYMWDARKHGGKPTQVLQDAVDLVQRAGINTFEMEGTIIWLANLYGMGLIGRGKKIESSLPFDQIGETIFAKQLFDAIVEGTDIGKDLAQGSARAAKAWGRYEEDTASGVLPLQAWGYTQHYDARTEVEWGYGSLLGERDINEHDFNIWVYWVPTVATLSGAQPPMSAEELSELMAKKLVPYSDPMMMDYSDEGIYSESMAKLVAWHRHYTRFYKQSLAYCDWSWADFYNTYGPDHVGMTGEGEQKFFNAVTGKNITFEEGLETGRKIWNLDRAIWVLQGRHKNMEFFTEQNYQVGAVPGFTTFEAPYVVPVHENGKWSYKNVAGRKLDKGKVEEWKVKYYKLEGWDPETGCPTRATLEKLGLANVADELAAAKKLPA